MRAIRSVCFTLIVWMFCSALMAAGQTRSTKQSTPKKAPTAAELSADVQNDEKLLQRPDVANSPKLSAALRADWITKTCQIEVLSLPASMQTPEFVDEVTSACLKRLNSQETKADITSAGTGGAPVVKAPTGSPCSVVADPATASGTNTKYGYKIQCVQGVTPKAMAISTSQAQPAITDAQGKAFALGFASAQGIAFTSYDSTKSIIGFTFPSGANPQSFELLVPTASTQLTSATYFIASGSVADATTCQPSSPAAGCSIGAILVPVPTIKLAAKCPKEPLDTTLAAPTLDAIDVGGDSATGTVPKATSGTVQLCSGGVPLGSPVQVDTKGAFTVKGLKQLPAAQGLKAGDKVQAQFTNTANISGPPSADLAVGSCSADQPKGASSKPPVLTLSVSTDGKNMATYSGTVPGATSGTVRICVNDLPSGDAKTAAIGSDGTFSGGTNGFKVSAGDEVIAQTVSSDTPPKYGPLSEAVPVGKCSSVETEASTTKPVLNPVITSSNSFSGTLPNARAGTEVRICVDDIQDATALVGDNGAFKGLFTKPPKAGAPVTAQKITPSSAGVPPTYGVLGPEQKVGGFRYSSLFGTFIAGVEQSGYSSEITNTNFFVSAYIRSSYLPLARHCAVGQSITSTCPNSLKPPSALGLALWGRTRLLSAPQPSTQNIVSVLTDPTGQISQSNFSKVGQVIDYTIGPELRLAQRDSSDGQTTRISLFAAVGATTPLTSDSVTLTYNAPGPNTPECAALVSRYPPNPSKGIAGLYPGPVDANGLQTTCIMNPVTKAAYQYVVFTNQNRSSFLGKYGGGLRLTHVYPAKGQGSPYDGSIDLGIGQDETITGGTFHGAVFKIDGQYPFAYGPMAFIYFFGSASMRLSGNQNYAPLVLTVPTGSMIPTIPSANVTVLSLQQPNRDFYRIGIGLNLLDVFSKLKSGPSTGNAAAGAGAAATDNAAPPAGGTGKGGTPVQPAKPSP